MTKKTYAAPAIDTAVTVTSKTLAVQGAPNAEGTSPSKKYL